MKTVTTIFMKFPEYTGNGSGIMPFNFPDISTLQWGAGRGLLSFASLFI